MTSKDEKIRAQLSQLVKRSKQGQAKPAGERLSQVAVGAPVASGRGPQKAPTKVPVSIRLDRDLVETLRASGRGWQSRLNDWLRDHLDSDGSATEKLTGHPQKQHSSDHGDQKRSPKS